MQARKIFSRMGRAATCAMQGGYRHHARENRYVDWRACRDHGRRNPGGCDPRDRQEAACARPCAARAGGAGVAASVPDALYEAAGAEIVDVAGALGADLVLKVRIPSEDELPGIRKGATLVGMLDPFQPAGLQRLADAGVTAYALEAAPRTTRAQSMDVLSSQANIAGYKAVMIAANQYQRFFPMLMTAAGTVKAARVVGAGRGRGPACRPLPRPSAWAP